MAAMMTMGTASATGTACTTGAASATGTTRTLGAAGAVGKGRLEDTLQFGGLIAGQLAAGSRAGNQVAMSSRPR